jgi:hypothetical protein
MEASPALETREKEKEERRKKSYCQACLLTRKITQRLSRLVPSPLSILALFGSFNQAKYIHSLSPNRRVWRHMIIHQINK